MGCRVIRYNAETSRTKVCATVGKGRDAPPALSPAHLYAYRHFTVERWGIEKRSLFMSVLEALPGASSRPPSSRSSAAVSIEINRASRKQVRKNAD